MLNSQINHRILGFGATPQTEHEDHRKPGSQRGKPGDQEKQGRLGGGWQDTSVQQSLLLLVPNFVLWYEQNSYVNSSILLRTFVHHHNALDRCAAAAALFKVLVSSFLFSVILHNSLCIFLQVEPIFPIFCSVDPITLPQNTYAELIPAKKKL